MLSGTNVDCMMILHHLVFHVCTRNCAIVVINSQVDKNAFYTTYYGTPEATAVYRVAWWC